MGKKRNKVQFYKDSTSHVSDFSIEKRKNVKIRLGFISIK